MRTFFPATGSEAEWNAAYYRLEDYLRALRIANKVHQSQIILRILEMAAARHALDPEQNPTALAMGEARSMMEQWFETILGRRERLAVAGLISLLVINAPGKWPVAFLCDQIPAEFRRAIQESEVRAGPDMQVSSMVPRPIDVSPLLDSIHLAGMLGRAPALAIVTGAVILGALSLSLFLLIR